MKSSNPSVAPRVRDTESGQSLVVVVLMLVVLLAVSALAIDMGNVYYSYRDLVSTTQSAALAGGTALSLAVPVDAHNAALQYSGRSTTDYNFHSNLNVAATVTANAQVVCIDPVVYANYGLGACMVRGPNPSGNAVQVTESTRVPTYFAKIFGVSSVPMSAKALAGAVGGAGSPWNVAVVVDTTGSMGTNDPSCGGLTRLNCALGGIQTLLKTMTPCTVGAACSSGNSVESVSLFTFPNITTTTASADYCGGGNPSVQPYTFPSSTPTSAGYTPVGTVTYQLLGYLNDYQVSPAPKTGPALSGSSNLTKASGGGSCAGLKNPGGAGTFYAGVIYAAQASLMKQQAANPTSQNAMIVLSDGDATATKSDMSASATATGTYPSYYGECQQAVTAAAAATALGTRIYTVAYGVAANQSGTCTSDKSTASYPQGTNITACQTIQAMGGGAQSNYFYSDANSTGSGCNSGKNKATSLNTIFLDIGNSFGKPRLVPNTVTFTIN